MLFKGKYKWIYLEPWDREGFLKVQSRKYKKKVDKHDRIKVNNIFMKDILKKVKRQLQTGRRYLKKIVLRMSIKNMKNSNKSVNNNKKDK